MELDCYKDGYREQDFKFLRVLGRGKHLGVTLCVQGRRKQLKFFFFFFFGQSAFTLGAILEGKKCLHSHVHDSILKWRYIYIHVPVFLPFHTVHEVLNARMLEWFAIPFSNGPHFARTLHQDPSILSGPTRHAYRAWQSLELQGHQTSQS